MKRSLSANRASRKSIGESSTNNLYGSDSFNNSQRSSNANLRDTANRYNLELPSSPHSDNSQGGNPMLETKFGRKRAETDLQLLANRIALLRLEEQKALQKVQETKLRAEEILETKRRHQEALEMKMKQNMAREEYIRSIQAKAAAEREERRMKLSRSKKLINDHRKAAAELKKEESKKLVEIAQTGKVMTEFEKRKKADEERKRRDQMRMERERERQQKEEEIRIAHFRKIEDEARKRKQAEDMIQMLENEEKQLIHRLRRTQEMQQQAYTTLQQSLNY